MDHDLIPELPEIKAEDFPLLPISSVYNDAFNSPRKLIMYEASNGQFMALFEGLDERFYAGFVTTLAQVTPRHNKLFEFFKLCMEGARIIKLNTRNGFKRAAR